MKYLGSCHCQKVRFAIEADIENAITCNCSICHRRGSILAFMPDAHFTLLSGENDMTEYLFGKKHIHHCFCSTCGILPFGYGKDKEGNLSRAINLRCLENFDLSKVKVTEYDGKNA